jgi:hypothetical protein
VFFGLKTKLASRSDDREFSHNEALSQDERDPNIWLRAEMRLCRTRMEKIESYSTSLENEKPTELTKTSYFIFYLFDVGFD